MKTKWDTDRIVSLSAMLVGLGSLFIEAYQTALVREQQKAQVLPYLLIAFNTNDNPATSQDSSAPSEKAVLETDYASVYGEHWRVRSDRVVPEPL